MFRIKICGVTSAADARLSAEAGADAIGLNFFSGSPRRVTLEAAREIAAAVPRHVCKVGVFVNASADEIRHTFADVLLDLVQLHGDEPPELLESLRGVPTMRAFRLGEDVAGDLAAAGGYLEACHRLRAVPRMVLVDAARAGHYGGTGATVNWQLVNEGRRHLAGAPLVLAGGLTSENVAAAIATVRPWAVDTASGVEDSPGRKSPERVAAFVAEATRALTDSARANQGEISK